MALVQQVHLRKVLLVGFDATLIVGAVSAAAWLRLGPEFAWSVLSTVSGLSQALIIAAILQLCLYFSDVYDFRVVADRHELFVRLLQALAAASILLAFIYYWFPHLMVGRGVFVLAAALIIVSMLGWRFAFQWATQQAPGRERLLIIGTTPAAVALAEEILERRNELGVEIVGFVDPDPANVGVPVLNPGIIGTIEDIPSIVQRLRVDRVVVSLADARGYLPMDKLLEIRLRGVSFQHLATVYEHYTGKIAVENLRPSWMIFAEGFRNNPAQRSIKRGLDVAISLVGLVIAAPLLVIVGVLVKLTSPGPVFYSQERVGLHGRTFRVHKFRSMLVDAEADTGPVWATRNDNRVTPIGTMLRRTRIDEVPQLWNILRGDMSMVGPRPERPEFVGELTRQIPFYGQRHVVKPGLTGWAQIRYTYGASVEDALQKLQYDLYYIKNMSIALDLFVMAATVKTVVLRRGAA
jgi:sugar transferase (PEP-CTERM system associated)